MPSRPSPFSASRSSSRIPLLRLLGREDIQVFEREGVLNEREEILDWEGMGWDRKDRCLGLDPERR